MTGHIVFSPSQARNLAESLLYQAASIDGLKSSNIAVEMRRVLEKIAARKIDNYLALVVRADVNTNDKHGWRLDGGAGFGVLSSNASQTGAPAYLRQPRLCRTSADLINWNAAN